MSDSSYSKPFLTSSEQLDLLESRGLAISDRIAAEQDLERIGYYRLSGYWYSFRQLATNTKAESRLDQFNDGYDFHDAVALYSFDRQLRLILMDAIERIEVAIRVRVAFEVGKLGAFAHLDASRLGGICNTPTRKDPSVTYHQEFSAKLETAIRDSSEVFAKHYREKYQGQVPIWVAIELWDFGMLSRFFQMLTEHDRELVAQSFGLDGKTLLSWLESLNLVRNICAHHGRLYRRTLANAPKVPDARHYPQFHHVKRLKKVQNLRAYRLLCSMKFLLDSIESGPPWHARLRDLMLTFPRVSNASTFDYGFPDNWQDEALWQLIGR